METLRDLKTSPPADRFIPVMSKFAEEAAMSVERIKGMGAAIDGDLKGLLAYFGEQSEVSSLPTSVLFTSTLDVPS